MATLNQPAYAPWPVEEQVAVIYAANTGVLDRIEVAQVPEVNEQIRRELRESASDVLAGIRDTKDLSDEAAAKIEEIAKKVAEQFAPSRGPVRPAVGRGRRGRGGRRRREDDRATADRRGDGGGHRLLVATTRDIKRRIDSVRNTRKITRAMELVASAKLRRAQDRIESLRPYAQAMRRLMAQAARQSGGAKGLALLEEREAEGTAIVVAITGDRGLAGAFNVNIVRPRDERRRGAARARASPRWCSRRSARRAPAPSRSAASRSTARSRASPSSRPSPTPSR